MQLVANQQLVKNRARLGLLFNFGAMAVLIFGLVFNAQLAESGSFMWETWATVLVGVGLLSLGQTQLRRWGPGRRQDEQIGQAIRGLDDRYKVYAFLSSSLPDYILVSPAGVHVLIVRPEAGQVACIRDRWSKPGGRLAALFGSPFGNPSADAAKDLQKLRALLEKHDLREVPRSSLVVFTNPRVQLRVEGCSSTITRTKDLKDVLRRMAGKGSRVALSTSRIKEIQRVFDQQMQAAHSWR